MITYQVEGSGVQVQVTQRVFSDGSVHVDINRGSLEPDFHVKRVCITARLKDPADQLALIFATDAIREAFPLTSIMLYLPYLPYARQDRICVNGEAHTLKRFGQLINMLDFCTVSVVDPHSIVAECAINRLHVLTQQEVFRKVGRTLVGSIVVAPDAGALKKAEAFAAYVGAAGVVACHKERNLNTREIIRQEILGSHDLFGRRVVVVDDLCDGGRTFIGLAEELRKQEPESLELIVSHGIFSQGTAVVTNVYDHVYTTDSFADPSWENEKLTIVKLV